jgi:hypothetical protein
LSYPKRLPPPYLLVDLLRLEFNCSTPDEQIWLLVHAAANANATYKQRMPADLLYPQNTMRNLARLHCKTQWVMCPDADMVFPDDTHHARSNLSMYARLKAFLRSEEARECFKCAFVFPLYEVEDLGHKLLPRSKSELLHEYVARNKSQVYHVQTFPDNQRNSNLSDWERLPLREDVVVAAKINYTWWYEPLYIVQQGSPIFDERYIGYGMTRNTQVHTKFSLIAFLCNNFITFILDTRKVSVWDIWSKALAMSLETKILLGFSHICYCQNSGILM